MDLQELRSVREQERRTDSLQHLRDSFYDDAVDYVRDLKRERSRRAEAAGDPYADEAMRLTDEIDTAEEVIESLYERRRGKVVKLASFAAAGMPADTDGMTDQEREMFADVVDRIEANEASVLGRLETGAADTTVPESTGGVAESATTESTSRAAEATASKPTAPGEPAGADKPTAPGESAGADEPTAPETAAEPAATPETTAAPESAAATGTTEAADDGGVLADAMGGPTESSPGSTAADTAPTASSADGAATTDPERPAAEAAAAAGPSETAHTDSASVTSADASAVPGPDSGTDASAAPGPDSGTDVSTAPDTDAIPTGDPSPAPDPGSQTPPADDPGGATGPTGGDPTGRDETPSDEPVAITDGDRATVRVTRDVGEVFGVDDRAYDLRASDVVRLPRAVAEPLVDRGAAESL